MLSVLLFSFNNVLWKQNLKFISIPFLVSYRAFFTSTISLAILFGFFTFEGLSIAAFIKITIGSLFGVVGLFSMLAVIKHISLQWLGIYNLLGVVFTILYLWLFDTVVIKEMLLGLLVIVFGFSGFLYMNKETKLTITLKQHLLLVLMTFSYSCSAILHWKNLQLNFSPLCIIANQEALVFLVGMVFTLKQRNGRLFISHLKKHFKKVFFMSTVVFLAILCSFLGIKETNPIISSLLFLAAPLTTIMFGAYFFKEKLSFVNVIFIIIILCGSFILQYQTV
jgi:positive regulator of sigma E activity